MAGKLVKDALVQATRALPASTTAVTSTAIDTGTVGSVATGQGEQPGEVEYLLSAPLLSTARLPDTKVMVYDIITSDNADLSSPTVLIDNAITQTGAAAAGAAAATYRFRLPSVGAKRYLGFTVTPSASGTGDASGATATLDGQF